MKSRLPLCVLAVLVLAGAPASCGESTRSRGHVDACEPVEETVKFCSNHDESYCQGVPAEFEAQCRDGCVMTICPNIHRCERGPSPRWCGTSCADRHGALYWNYLRQAQLYCEYETRATRFAQPSYRECVIRHAQVLCPDLRGTRWTEDYGEMNHGALFQPGNKGAKPEGAK